MHQPNPESYTFCGNPKMRPPQVQTGPGTCLDLPHLRSRPSPDPMFAMALRPAPCSYIFLVGPPPPHEGPHGAGGSIGLLPSGCSEFAALFIPGVQSLLIML